MSELDHAHSELEDVLKGTLEINPGLESILRRKEVKRMRKHFESAFDEQIEKLLRSGVFKRIDNTIGTKKADDVRIYTESDEEEIADAVDAFLQPIARQRNTAEAFADFLIIIFNLGGQDFLDKHRIPATFDLTNEDVIGRIIRRSKASLSGMDQTTSKWITDQVIDLRSKGLSNARIADEIRDLVPQTYTNRAEAIVRTETSYMVGDSEHETAVNNGASHKEWVTVGGACPICEENAEAGTIGVAEKFPSGDPMEPAHPNCRCLVEYIFTPFQGFIWHGQ